MDFDDKLKKPNNTSDAKDNLVSNIENTKSLIETFTNNIHSGISIDEENKPILIYEILNNLNNLYNNILSLQSNINSVNLDNRTVSEMSKLTDILASIKDSLSLIKFDSSAPKGGDNSPSDIPEIISSLIACIDALNSIVATRSLPIPPLNTATPYVDTHEPIKSTSPSTSGTSAASGATGATTSAASTTSSNTISDLIKNTAALLVNINSIRTELIRLFINLKEPIYFTNSVAPLLTILSQLSATSYSLSASQDLLSKSIITHAKSSKIKDTIHLIYNINEECDDVYKELKRRIDFLLKI